MSFFFFILVQGLTYCIHAVNVCGTHEWLVCITAYHTMLNALKTNPYAIA